MKLGCVLNAQEAQQFADEEGLLFFETSAKSAQNVTELFTAIGSSSLISRPSSEDR